MFIQLTSVNLPLELRAGSEGPVSDISESVCSNISPLVPLLISVFHSHWFSKSVMLVKELITWIGAGWHVWQPRKRERDAKKKRAFLFMHQTILLNHRQSNSMWTWLVFYLKNNGELSSTMTVAVHICICVYAKLALPPLRWRRAKSCCFRQFISKYESKLQLLAHLPFIQLVFYYLI